MTLSMITSNLPGLITVKIMEVGKQSRVVRLLAETDESVLHFLNRINSLGATKCNENAVMANVNASV